MWNQPIKADLATGVWTPLIKNEYITLYEYEGEQNILQIVSNFFGPQNPRKYRINLVDQNSSIQDEIGSAANKDSAMKLWNEFDREMKPFLADLSRPAALDAIRHWLGEMSTNLDQSTLDFLHHFNFPKDEVLIFSDSCIELTTAHKGFMYLCVNYLCFHASVAFTRKPVKYRIPWISITKLNYTTFSTVVVSTRDMTYKFKPSKAETFDIIRQLANFGAKRLLADDVSHGYFDPALKDFSRTRNGVEQFQRSSPLQNLFCIPRAELLQRSFDGGLFDDYQKSVIRGTIYVFNRFICFHSEAEQASLVLPMWRIAIGEPMANGEGVIFTMNDQSQPPVVLYVSEAEEIMRSLKNFMDQATPEKLV